MNNLKEQRQSKIEQLKKSSSGYSIGAKSYSHKVIAECLEVWYLGIDAKQIKIEAVNKTKTTTYWVKCQVNGKTYSLFISSYLLAFIKLSNLITANKAVELSTFGTVGVDREYNTTLVSCDCDAIKKESEAFKFRLNGRPICEHQLAVAKQVAGCANLSEYLKVINRPNAVRVAQLNQALQSLGIKSYSPNYHAGYSVKIENLEGLRYTIGYSEIRSQWFYSRPNQPFNRYVATVKDLIEAIQPKERPNVDASEIFPQGQNRWFSIHEV